MTFLEFEDRALKRKFTNELTVSDPKNASRGVDIWFRYPDKEVRDVSYPFITLAFSGLRKADEREERGTTRLHYMPGGGAPADPTDATALVTEIPIPYEIYYTVTTHCRDPRHDRQLLSQLLQYNARLSMRNAWLEVEEDNTIRRLDVIGMDPADYRDNAQKYVHRKVFTISVSAEIFPSAIVETKIPEHIEVILSEQGIDFIVTQNEPVPGI